MRMLTEIITALATIWQLTSCHWHSALIYEVGGEKMTACDDVTSVLGMPLLEGLET